MVGTSFVLHKCCAVSQQWEAGHGIWAYQHTFWNSTLHFPGFTGMGWLPQCHQDHSQIVGRVNTIRNASHFHQFEHDLCSCINYWWWQQSVSSIISEVGSLSQYGEGSSLILQNLKCKSVVHDQNNLGTLLMGWLWRMANHEWVHCFPWILQLFKVGGILVQWQHDIYSTQMDMLHQMNGRLKVAYYREDISFCAPVGIPITFVASVVKS